MKKKYTVKEILKAAEIGDVSMVDAYRIVSLLDEAHRILKSSFNCDDCKNLFMNPFDQYYCEKEIDIDSGEDCGGKYFNKK